jgi:hypothetical protein
MPRIFRFFESSANSVAPYFPTIWLQMRPIIPAAQEDDSEILALVPTKFLKKVYTLIGLMRRTNLNGYYTQISKN